MKKYKDNIMIEFLLFLTLTIIFVLGIIKILEAQSSNKQILARNIYIDPKGFFKIRPPEGWEIEEFKDDPRGKVKFIHPNVFNTVLQVRGQANPYSSFEELVVDCERDSERLKSNLRAVTTIERISFANAASVRINITIPGKLKQIQIKFLLGENYYTLAYGAPPDKYAEFLSTVMMSFESIEPILKNVKEEEMIRHLVAGKLRTSRNLVRAGEMEYALIIVNEGLNIDPNNKELIELKKQIENK
jgi:hypothetical protein